MISKKEDSINITVEMAEWPVRDIIKLLDVLEKNDYKKTFFDGNNAAFYVLRERITERN